MKLVIVTRLPDDPDAPHGGVESASVNLLRALAEFNDMDLHVVTTDPLCAQAAISTWNGMSIHRLPWRGRRVLTYAIGAGRRHVSEYVSALEPDVIHSHDVYGLMVKGVRIPRVFTVHGFIYGDTRVSGERLAWLRSHIWRWVETAGWADQPHIISISPYVRERLAGIVRGIVHDIDNPISLSFFDISRNEHKGRIFSAGLICQRKNTLSLVEAFARLIEGGVDAELRVAGTIANADYGRRVEDRIRARGLTGRVVLLGKLTLEQIREELATASVFALVSLEEGSPMCIEEAMAAGVPVVTSNRCGMPYMVRDGESGYLVDPNDPEDIAWRLTTLLQDDDLRYAMSLKCRGIAKDRFHPAAVARRTREVYLRAIRDYQRRNGRARL